MVVENYGAALQTAPLQPASAGALKTPRSASLMSDLVRYATLAPSSHNTQCWRFQVDNNDSTITVLPNFERSCPVVDPDNHHLYVSLGCAIENLVVAAKAHGYQAEVDSTCPKDGIQVKLYPSNEVELTDLFEAIPKRQVTRCEYDGKPLSETELNQLEEAGMGHGVRVILVNDTGMIEIIQEHVVRANTAQMNNPLFKEELRSWVRFNEKEVARKGDGLSGKCTGNPSAPRFIGNIIFNHVVRPSTENSKIIRQIKSSAGIAIFVSEHDDPVHWVEVGRCYEHFALRATVLGVRNAMLNQPIEEQDLRPQFSKAMGLKESERPDLVVRFGKGPEMPFSPRRPLGDVLE